MEREYDLFERSEDRGVMWRGSVRGLENARRKLQEIAEKTTLITFRDVRELTPIKIYKNTIDLIFIQSYNKKNLERSAHASHSNNYMYTGGRK